MTYLLDTNLLLWSILQQDRLSATAKELFLDPQNTFAYSSVSIWEVGIKHLKHPSSFPVQPERLFWAVQELDYLGIEISGQHAIAASLLPLHHRDPFDRMLVAQAASENLLLLTADHTLPLYGSHVQVV